MSEKTAFVAWQGAGKTGKGQVSTESKAIKDLPYNFGTRFDEHVGGTNPEELLAAAHAACFTMAFAFAAEQAGFAVRQANSQAKVRLRKSSEGFAIDRIVLRLEAKVPGLHDVQFQQLATQAKTTCPLSKALAGVEQLQLEAVLLA
jgi:osmotically inducible protein OsmC